MAAPPLHVLGAGSVGLLLATRLSAAFEVVLVGRPGSAAGVADYLLGDGEARHALSLPHTAPERVEHPTHLILCTKAYDAESALAPLADRLGGTRLLLMQNGMGSQQAIAERFPVLSLHAASSTEGAYRPSQRHVVHAGRGVTRIGLLRGQPFHWASLFERAGLTAETTDAIESVLADKLRVNALINPLTVLYRCRNGELLSQPTARQRMAALGAEADAVLTAAGYRFARPAFDAACAVAEHTAGNYSSMYQDAAAGRRLEIDYINGYLVRLAQRLERDAPEHRRLCVELARHAPPR